MNKNFKLSLVAATVISTLFIGCSSDSATAPAGSAVNVGASKGTLVGTTVTVGGGSALSDSTGLAAVTGATGTVITTGLDGIDVTTGAAPTRAMVSDITIVDAAGNAIVNAFTDTAIKVYGATDANASMIQFAAKLGVTPASLQKVITNSAADAALEKQSRLLFDQVSAFVAADNLSTLVTTLATATDFNSTLIALNASSNVLTSVSDAVAAVNNPAVSGATLAVSDGNYTAASLAANTVLISNAIVLDTNTTTATVSGVATLSRMDTNGTVSLTKDNGTDESASLAIEIDSRSNDNASYAIVLYNLLVTEAANGYISTLASNANTSAIITAYSTNDKAATFAGSEVNATAVMNTITDDNGTAGFMIDVGALATYITDVVGTDLDTTDNGNFTSAMAAGSSYDLTVLLDVNENNMTTSDQTFSIYNADKIWYGDDSASSTDGDQFSGYTVVDSNVSY